MHKIEEMDKLNKPILLETFKIGTVEYCKRFGFEVLGHRSFNCLDAHIWHMIRYPGGE